MEANLKENGEVIGRMFSVRCPRSGIEVGGVAKMALEAREGVASDFH